MPGYDWKIIKRLYAIFCLPVDTATSADLILPSGSKNNMMNFASRLISINSAFWLIAIKIECCLLVNLTKKSIRELQRKTLNIGAKPCGPRACTARDPKGGTSTHSNIQIGETMCPTIYDMIR